MREHELLEDGDLVERSLGVFKKLLGEQLRLLELYAEVHRLDPSHDEFVPQPRIGSGDDQIDSETEKSQGSLVGIGFTRPLARPQIHFGELVAPMGRQDRPLVEMADDLERALLPLFGTRAFQNEASGALTNCGRSLEGVIA